MYKYWLIHCNKSTTPMQVVNNGETEVEGEEIYETLYFLPNFSVNLKLF